MPTDYWYRVRARICFNVSWLVARHSAYVFIQLSVVIVALALFTVLSLVAWLSGKGVGL